MFGVVFPDRSYPMDPSSFNQIDPLHWVLDLSTLILGPATTTTTSSSSFLDIKRICIFLLSPQSLPPDKAISVYLQPPGGPDQPFLFCGAIHAARPSAVLSLPWPEQDQDAPAAIMPSPSSSLLVVSPKIGISVEDVSVLPPVSDAGTERKVEKMALKVGENLFHFMQSFCGVDGNTLVVPMDILDRWFKKFQEKANRDPTYLKGFSAA